MASIDDWLNTGSNDSNGNLRNALTNAQINLAMDLGDLEITKAMIIGVLEAANPTSAAGELTELMAAAAAARDRARQAFDAASVYKEIKAEMEMDEVNCDAFKRAVADKDTKQVSRYLAHVSPFNSSGALLTVGNVNAIMVYFLDDVRKDELRMEIIRLREEIFDVKVNDEKTNEESLKRESEISENGQSLMEGVLSICSVLFYIGMSIWGISEHLYDGIVIVELCVVLLLACIFGISEIDICKNDICCAAVQQVGIGFVFVALGMISGTATLGPILNIIALFCYFIIYIVCMAMMIYIGCNIKLIQRCRANGIATNNNATSEQKVDNLI